MQMSAETSGINQARRDPIAVDGSRPGVLVQTDAPMPCEMDAPLAGCSRVSLHRAPGGPTRWEDHAMRSIGLALALVSGLIVPAYAGTYSTSSVIYLSGGLAVCSVSNVGTTPINVTVTLIDALGAVVTSPGVNNCANNFGGVLPAGLACESFVTTPAGIDSDFVRCSVESSSSKIRAALIVLDSTGAMVASVPATKK
jgi:hypothetical protein